MKEVLSLSDILADAYHNFMPSYRDYMLQRGGESTGRARKSNNSTGFGDTSSSEGSPTPMANNARVPRFVIDDEDDEMDEIDLESNVTTAASSAELPTAKNKLPELKLPEEKEVKHSEADADVIMANPQDDDNVKADETALEEGVFGFGTQRPLWGHWVPYWPEKELQRINPNHLLVDVGSVSSDHDRACELFYQLVGGRVDYG
ncbi:Hypothetical protein PHPALM_36119, partial [Phytophthora palmivora]